MVDAVWISCFESKRLDKQEFEELQVNFTPIPQFSNSRIGEIEGELDWSRRRPERADVTVWLVPSKILPGNIGTSEILEEIVNLD